MQSSSTTPAGRWIGPAVLLALALAMFGDVLFTRKPIVLSDEQNDLASQFLYWRAFTADELRQGRLPLWNPHVYGGMPFFGAAPTGVLYPPNWLDLLLPLHRTINIGIALHVFLAGLFTYLWGRRRGLSPVAATVAGALFMFSGAYFLHVYAGHSSVCSLAWTPLVFASLEQKQSRGWILAGTAAIAMQIFTGDMQTCFYTAVAAGLLAATRLRTLAGLLGMYAGAAALGAVQLLAGTSAATESVRSGGVSYEFASMVSFAPENFLTLLAPGFFGDMVKTPYWGRWYLWEMCPFIGVSGLALAVYGSGRQRRLAAVTMILLVLALGANTPLFRILYHGVPGFDRFRGNAKFIAEASLLMTILAGAGLDRLLAGPNRRFALGVAVAGVIVAGAAIYLRSATWWPQAMQTIYNTQETYSTGADQAQVFASNGLLIAAAKLLVLGALLASRKLMYAMVLMAIVEVFVFARPTRPTFEVAATESPNLKAFLDERPGDYRIFYQRTPNIAMWLGREDVWGYAPLMLKRYAEFMAFTQAQPLDDANQYLEFSRFHPLHALLRWRYAFLPGKEGDRILTAPFTLPRLQLVNEYRVLSGRDQILPAMAAPDFDPQRQVILETEPHPAPLPSAEKGKVRIVESRAGSLTIEADLPQPAILLITDAYSKGWRARPATYTVLPADYVLRAVPLGPGHHRFQLEYRPAAFQAGLWISLVSFTGFAIISARLRKRNS